MRKSGVIRRKTGNGQTNHCAFGQTWPATMERRGVKLGSCMARTKREKAGPEQGQRRKRTQARAWAEAGGDGTVGNEKAQASGARGGPDAGEVGVEARTRWVAKERVVNEGQACTTAVCWLRIVGTRATGNLPFFHILLFRRCRGSWAPEHWETCQLLSSWQNKSRKKRTECRRMQHSCEEQEAEGAASVGATMVNIVGGRLGWEFGWRREDSKVLEEKLVRRWHCCE